MKQHGSISLRPWLWRAFERGRRTGRLVRYARFSSVPSADNEPETDHNISPNSSEFRARAKELRDASMLKYPRLMRDPGKLNIAIFHTRFKYLENGATAENETITIQGRIARTRELGSKLVFLEVARGGSSLQGLSNLNNMSAAGITETQFKKQHGILRRGDHITMTGRPHRTERGELSLKLTTLPQLLSPSLHQIPTELLDQQTRTRNKHVDLLVHPSAVEPILIRSEIIQFMRQFLRKNRLWEVQTPILAATAGGAVARPFTTTASEFPDRKIQLRIAPELWLKRLILGGMEGVFEIGPCFRNEGIDLTHNPEFYMCEYYQAFADMRDLMALTEDLLFHLATYLESRRNDYPSLSSATRRFRRPFRRIYFVPAIEEAIKRRLPDLSGPQATDQLLQIFQELNIEPPVAATLPRLLDRLSTMYIEPQCTEPTMVLRHPECLSPLAKSFNDLHTRQRVSARMELFVDQVELINAYEEENSPFEQRRKFMKQLQYREEVDAARDPDKAADPTSTRGAIDESYLQALEWGLPPTGGWGCGIDRLAMLFAGTKRINDVLSFGTLRNVISV